MKWIGTFAQRSPLKNNWVSFEAKDYDEAHKVMTQHYDLQWSMLYTFEAWEASRSAKYFPGGEIPLGAQAGEQDVPDETDIYRSIHPPLIDVPSFGNEFNVQSLVGGSILIHRGPVGPLTPMQAYCLAAWLVLTADSMSGTEGLFFEEILSKCTEVYDGKTR